jgi:uncharacterized protein (DUF1800 family)
MRIFSGHFIVLVVSLFGLSACGGGGGGASDNIPPMAPAPAPEISLLVVQSQAYEGNQNSAELTINRTGSAAALSISYVTAGHSEPSLGSASSGDYEMLYEDGSAIGSTINLSQNQNSLTIQVRPLVDNQREIPETLTLTLATGSGYSLSENISAEIIISEATNDVSNSRLFLGTFKAQDGISTSASGLLSFILQGDNDKGTLTYTYANLGTQRTDQHLHLSPSGTIIHDIKDEDLQSAGNVSDYQWDLAPGGIFTTKQQMLDALFDGEFYINVHSADFPGGEIYAPLIFDASAEPPEQLPLSTADVDFDIVRFLTQATFGATPEDYSELRSLIDIDGDNRQQVYELWIEQQFAMPATSMLDLDDHIYALFPSYNHAGLKPESFWSIASFAKDQLRQRMTFALSEIMVISSQDSKIRQRARGIGSYWDTLSNNAFGSYRQLIEDVTMHPMMGVYLSHLRNQKANEAEGTFPDENYAREVMQLFTFGLVHRNQDGSIILGQDNLPIATYDNETIQNLARVFTGLALSYRSDNDGTNVKENGSFNRTSCGPANSAHYCWTQPMKFFPSHHDFGEKKLFTDNGEQLVISASSGAELSEAVNELGVVLDGLIDHNTTAPFIARRLIQRFVTSNPSRDYIQRVAIAFGETGDMQSVIKAILLDQEARTPSVANSATFGKFKEPLLQLTAVMRLFQANSRLALGADDEDSDIIGTNYQYVNHFSTGATIIKLGNIATAVGQQALGAPSVFNFFSPDYSPAGSLASQGLVAPELTLVTESQMYSMLNGYHQFLNNGVVNYRRQPFTKDQVRVSLDTSGLNAVWDNQIGDDTAKATAVVDYIDFYLNSGKLKQTDNKGTRQELITTIQSAACVSEPMCERNNLAIYGTATAPEFQIQQ